jgi:DNA-binding NtrC family response regulator
MPNGDGVFLLKYVKSNFPKIPHICLISGYTEVSVGEAKKLGAIDLIAKPPDLDQLIAMVKDHCECN